MTIPLTGLCSLLLLIGMWKSFEMRRTDQCARVMILQKLSGTDLSCEYINPLFTLMLRHEHSENRDGGMAYKIKRAEALQY